MSNSSQSQFIHLRCHSEYSISDGIVRIPDYVKKALETNMPAIGLTDLSNLFGAVKFFKSAVAAGIKPIFGADVWIENDARSEPPHMMLLLCQNPHPGSLREELPNLRQHCLLIRSDFQIYLTRN